MSVACSGNVAVLVKEVKLNLIRVCEIAVKPVFFLILNVAFLVFLSKLSIHGEKVHISVLCRGKPGKVVNRHGVNFNFIASCLYATKLLKSGAKKLLCTENLVAAAESLNLREHSVKGLDAEGHRIGVVYNPSIGAVILDSLCDFLIHRNGAHCSYYSARSACVANRLINSVFFRGMNV